MNKKNMEKKNKKRISEKEKLFVKFYKTCKTAKEAATKAGYSEHTARQMGCNLLKKDRIKKMLQKQDAKLQKKFEYTVKESFDKFKEIQDLSLSKEDLANAVRCEENKAKLFGLYVEKKEIKEDLNIKNYSSFLDSLED